MANFQPAALIEYDGRLLNGTDLLYDTTQGVRIWGNATQDNYSIGDTTTGGVDSTYGNNNLAFGQFALNAINASGTTKSYNIAIGTSSLQSLGTATSVGLNAGYNISIGANTAKLVKAAFYNIFIGRNVLSNYNLTAAVGRQTLIGDSCFNNATSIGYDNTVLGALNCPLATSIGQENTILGSKIGEFAVGVGSDSVFIGAYVSATSSYLASSSVYIGTFSGPNKTLSGTLENNVYIGANSTGSQDSTEAVAIGYYSFANSRCISIGNQAGTNSSSVNNTIVLGYNSGRSATASGTFNITIGNNSANILTSGSDNILIGSSTATNLTTGSSNIIIGQSVSAQTAAGSNNIDILTNVSTTATGIQFTNSSSTLKLLAPLVNVPTGRFLINGTTSDDNIPIQVSNTVSTTTTANIYTYYHTPTISPANGTNTNLAGNAIGIYVNPKYATNIIPNSGSSHYSAMQLIAGATSALTTAIPDVRGLTISFTPGLYAATVAPTEYTHIRLTDPSLNGSTATYNIYSGSNSSTGKWNLYLVGTASNHILSTLLLGSAVDSGTGEKLQVTGTALISSNLKVAGTQINTSTQANTAWLATGTANSTTFLRGDGTWATVTGTSVTPSIARTFALMGA